MIWLGGWPGRHVLLWPLPKSIALFCAGYEQTRHFGPLCKKVTSYDYGLPFCVESDHATRVSSARPPKQMQKAHGLLPRMSAALLVLAIHDEEV